ncbi:hypothetical protein ACVIJ6_003843 [Bradyrhizobium sp. USDA 4369]
MAAFRDASFCELQQEHPSSFGRFDPNWNN